MTVDQKTPETRGKTGIPTLPGMEFRQPTATYKGATGVGKNDSRKCVSCGAAVRVYDYDAGLRVYLGPRRVDPTPLNPQLAEACRATGRPIFAWHRDLTGRTELTRVWEHEPTPGGVLLPEHACGARTPTRLERRPDDQTPETCPF